MAATIPDSPAQYERDLRSANQEWKRSKDARVKWSYGSTASWSYGLPEPDLESQNFRVQPLSRLCDLSAPPKDRGNINKFARTTGRMKDCLPTNSVRSKVSAKEEIDAASRSVLDFLPSPVSRQNSAMDDVLYSFDRTESPGRPLTLDIFVKTTGRDTEKLVEKEYEILDANGEAVKGRKARRTLRHGKGTGTKSADDQPEVDEDGFELV